MIGGVSSPRKKRLGLNWLTRVTMTWSAATVALGGMTIGMLMRRGGGVVSVRGRGGGANGSSGTNNLAPRTFPVVVAAVPEACLERRCLLLQMLLQIR